MIPNYAIYSVTATFLIAATSVAAPPTKSFMKGTSFKKMPSSTAFQGAPRTSSKLRQTTPTKSFSFGKKSSYVLPHQKHASGLKNTRGSKKITRPSSPQLTIPFKKGLTSIPATKIPKGVFSTLSGAPTTPRMTIPLKKNVTSLPPIHIPKNGIQKLPGAFPAVGTIEPTALPPLSPNKNLAGGMQAAQALGVGPVFCPPLPNPWAPQPWNPTVWDWIAIGLIFDGLRDRPCHYVQDCVTVSQPVAYPVETPSENHTVVEQNISLSEESSTEANTTATDSQDTHEPLTQLQAGSTFQLPAKGLGEKEGRVAIRVGAVFVPCAVHDWNEEGFKATIGSVALAQATRAELLVLAASGEPAVILPIELLPGSPSAMPTSSSNPPSS